MTAILTQRCDPFGIEVERYGERLAGGLYPDAKVGHHIWHCEEPVIGRFRMRCTGGEYGFRRANDGGIIQAYHCDGGHEGQVMNLCRLHVREYNTTGYMRPKPLNSVSYDAAGRAQHWAPGSVVGGSRANDMCPRCAKGGEEGWAAMGRADFLQQQLSGMMIAGILPRIAAIQSELDQVRAKLDEMNERGFIHKCPLILREVS